MAAGYHLIIDGTGNHAPGQFARQLSRMNDGGYAVEVLYVDRPVMDAMQDTITRAIKDGRYVPSEITIKTHQSVSQNFPQVAQLPFLRQVRVFSEGQLIAEGGKGEAMRSLDDAAYTAFTMKAQKLI